MPSPYVTPAARWSPHTPSGNKGRDGRRRCGFRGPGLRLAGATAQTAAPGAGVLRLSDNLFVVQLPGEANVVAHTTPDGVVLVDGASAGAHEALMKAVASLPGGGPVHTLFNTHWHPEQTGSNEPLGRPARRSSRRRTRGCG